MSTPDIGCSSTNGGVQLNAGATCFISDGLLLADHGCGEGSIAMENLGDIQVLPGQTAQSLTSCFIFCPIWCFNKQSFFINLLARRKWIPIRLPTFTFINQWVSCLPVHWELVFGSSPRLWDKIRESLWDIGTLGLDQTMVLMHWLTQFVTYKKKCKLRLNLVHSKTMKCKGLQGVCWQVPGWLHRLRVKAS